jgi:hypothetical protein
MVNDLRNTKPNEQLPEGQDIIIKLGEKGILKLIKSCLSGNWFFLFYNLRSLTQGYENTTPSVFIGT